ncbi:hypothetical protein [Aeromonas hydrophila]|uniref:hypothetical protein n=1 Tax=Aeromonas hydrophila TaxID=644 RepID=UPI003D1EC720
MTLDEYKLLLTTLDIIRVNGTIDKDALWYSDDNIFEVCANFKARHLTISMDIEKRCFAAADERCTNNIVMREAICCALITELDSLPLEDQFTYIMTAGYPE